MGKESKYMKNSTSKVITRNRDLNVESENVGVTPGSITHLPCVLGPINSLSLSFVICKIEIISALTVEKIFERIK